MSNFTEQMLRSTTLHRADEGDRSEVEMIQAGQVLGRLASILEHASGLGTCLTAGLAAPGLRDIYGLSKGSVLRCSGAALLVGARVMR